MEQAQTKALVALQPFIAEATSSKSPSTRFLKELIIRATSASGTYIFTELLQTPAIQALRTAEQESRAYLSLLEVFSWGTYEEYISASDLPPLSDVQTEKLRLLSLLTLASPFAPLNETGHDPLTYAALTSRLGLKSTQQLESLVTTAIYSGLITARLSPTSNPPTVNITAVAPLRDLRPQSLSALLQILQTWESRCVTVANELETTIAAIKTEANHRALLQKKRQEVVDSAVITGENESNKVVRSRTRQGNKRDLDERLEGEDDEDVSSDEAKMDLDDTAATMDLSSRGGSSMTGRGTKRNRGRGSV